MYFWKDASWTRGLDVDDASFRRLDQSGKKKLADDYVLSRARRQRNHRRCVKCLACLVILTVAFYCLLSGANSLAKYAEATSLKCEINNFAIDIDVPSGETRCAETSLPCSFDVTCWPVGGAITSQFLVRNWDTTLPSDLDYGVGDGKPVGDGFRCCPSVGESCCQYKDFEAGLFCDQQGLVQAGCPSNRWDAYILFQLDDVDEVPGRDLHVGIVPDTGSNLVIVGGVLAFIGLGLPLAFDCVNRVLLKMFRRCSRRCSRCCAQLTWDNLRGALGFSNSNAEEEMLSDASRTIQRIWRGKQARKSIQSIKAGQLVEEPNYPDETPMCIRFIMIFDGLTYRTKKEKIKLKKTVEDGIQKVVAEKSCKGIEVVHVSITLKLDEDASCITEAAVLISIPRDIAGAAVLESLQPVAPILKECTAKIMKECSTILDDVPYIHPTTPELQRMETARVTEDAGKDFAALAEAEASRQEREKDWGNTFKTKPAASITSFVFYDTGDVGTFRRLTRSRIVSSPFEQVERLEVALTPCGPQLWLETRCAKVHTQDMRPSVAWVHPITASTYGIRAGHRICQVGALKWPSHDGQTLVDALRDSQILADALLKPVTELTIVIFEHQNPRLSSPLEQFWEDESRSRQMRHSQLCSIPVMQGRCSTTGSELDGKLPLEPEEPRLLALPEPGLKNDLFAASTWSMPDTEIENTAQQCLEGGFGEQTLRLPDEPCPLPSSLDESVHRVPPQAPLDKSSRHPDMASTKAFRPSSAPLIRSPSLKGSPATITRSRSGSFSNTCIKDLKKRPASADGFATTTGVANSFGSRRSLQGKTGEEPSKFPGKPSPLPLDNSVGRWPPNSPMDQSPQPAEVASKVLSRPNSAPTVRTNSKSSVVAPSLQRSSSLPGGSAKDHKTRPSSASSVTTVACGRQLSLGRSSHASPVGSLKRRPGDGQSYSESRSRQRRRGESGGVSRSGSSGERRNHPHHSNPDR